jgi:folate-binding protein YgfZ
MQLDYPISTSQLRSLRSGASLAPEPVAVFRVEGPGALTCLQGLLTCDLAAPGDASLSYGALLTPKGMIVVDPWVLREADRFTLLLGAPAREAAAQLLKRVLPPRLARLTDLSEEWGAAWLLGSAALDRFARVNATPLPGAGRVVNLGDGRAGLLAGGTTLAPFSGLVLGPATELTALLERAERAGMARGNGATLAAARVLAGWPTLGREIDERTLPQEVRFDELGAVSYVKGCYTGQETVARVHFRGHVNRTLRGVKVAGALPLSQRSLMLGDKDAGTIRTALLLEGHLLALAVVRREVEADVPLRAGDREVNLVHLPVDPV